MTQVGRYIANRYWNHFTPLLTLHERGDGTNDKWSSVYIDEQANPQQRDALSTIATGQAGGAPARLGQAISITNFLGIKFVPTSFRKKLA